MGKVISFNPAKIKEVKKLPEPTSQEPVQQAEFDYLDSLQPLVEEAKRLAGIYGLGAKDVLTDSLCLLIEEAIMDECQRQLDDPEPIA